MKDAEIRRETSLVQACPGGPLGRLDLHLTVIAGSEEDALEVRFGAPQRRSDGLCDLARNRMLALAERLPFAQGLSVETGVVRTALWRHGRSRWTARWEFSAALWREVVLGIETLPGQEPFDTPWNGATEPEAIDSRLPVILGPSAALAVVSYGLEALGSRSDPGLDTPLPALRIVDTARSPYPPQRLSRTAGDHPSQDRVLLDEGVWQDRGGSDGLADPVFFLLTRPERALRPLAVSSHFGRRNLDVRASRPAQLPAAALIVDSCRPRVGPRRGPVPFDAEVSLAGSRRDWRAAISPVRLHFDPWQLLAHARGGIGRARPAIDRDPIEGDTYGWAPFLLLDRTVSQLISGEPG